MKTPLSSSKIQSAAGSIFAAPLQAVDDLLHEAGTVTQRSVDRALDFARQHPEKALLYAAAAGFVLRKMPLARLLGGLCGVALPLVKPAMFLYGVSKTARKRR